MPIARFQMPDGRTARFEVPEGTTPEQAQAQIETHLGLGTDAKPVPFRGYTPSGERPETTRMEALAGSPGVRFALGAASPVLGAAQLGSEALGAKGITEHLTNLEEMKRKGMDFLEGPDSQGGGSDIAGIAGTILSPAVLGAMKIPMAGSVLGRAGQGAAVGAGFGAASPVTQGDDYWSTKLDQIGIGGLLGGVIPPAIEGGRKLYEIGRNILDPLLPGGVQRGASRLLAEAAASKRPEIEGALAENRQFVPGSQPTAGEAAAVAGSPEFTAMQRIAREHQPAAYNDIAKSQEAARLAAVRGIGRDKPALEAAIKNRADDATEAYGAIRHLKIDPRSDVEIMRDAIESRAASKGEALRDWGRFATREAEMTTRGENFSPVAGMPRVSARASNFPERVAEAKEAARDSINIAKQRYGEETFLENTMDLLKQTVGMGEKNLQFFLRRPSIREAVKDAMKSAQETGVYFPTKAGDKFSIGNLQRMKESLDAGISASRTSAAAGKRPDLSPAELEGTKQAFIKWLSGKSPEWQAARQQYALNSRPINQMQVGQELETALVKPIGEGERVGVFAGAVSNMEKTIKEATGKTLKAEEILQPEQLATVKNVLADLARKAEADRLSGLGRGKAASIAQPFGLPATGPLNQQYMIFKTVLGRISKGVTEKTLDEVADALKLPQSALKLLQRAPTANQAKLVDQLIAMKLGRGAIAASAEMASEAAQQ